MSYLAIAKAAEARLKAERDPEAVLTDLYRKYWNTPETEPIQRFQALHRDIDILERQIGAETTWRILEAAARRWHQETGVWPPCKLPGVPETERDAIPELGLDLEAFEREGWPLEIKTPWLANPLWFVPSAAEADGLVREGVHRGRIRTAKELIDLLAIPGLTKEQVQQIATAKRIFEGTVQE